MGFWGFGLNSKVYGDNENTGLKEPDYNILTDEEKLLIEALDSCKFNAVEVDRNLVNVRDNLGIPRDEKTYLVLKRKTLKSLLGKEIFILATRKYIYCIYKGETHKISLENACLLRLVRDKEYKYHVLSSDGSDLVVYDEGFLEGNNDGSIGYELGKFIEVFQKKWYSVSTQAQNDIKQYSDKLTNQYKNLDDEILEDDARGWIDFVLSIDGGIVELHKIKVNYAINIGNIELLTNQIHQYFVEKGDAEELVSFANEKLNSVLTSVKDDSVNDSVIKTYLSNYSSENVKEVVGVVSQYLDREYLSLMSLISTYKKVMAYIQSKMDLSLSPDEINQLSMEFDSSERETFLHDSIRIKNRQMSQIFAKDSYSEIELKYRDAFGLTPIHYMLLKGQFNKLPKEGDNCKDIYAFSEDETVKVAYSYITWAVAFGEETRDFTIELLKNAPDYKPFRDVIAQLEKRIKFQEAKIKLTEASIKQTKRAIDFARKNSSSATDPVTFNEKIGEFRENLSRLENAYNSQMKELDDICKELNEARDDFISTINSDIEYRMDAIEGLSKSDDFLEKFVHALLTKRIKYEDVLESSQSENSRFYSIHGINFCMTEDMFVFINSKKVDDQEHSSSDNQKKNTRRNTGKKQTNGAINKPYGGSWFSSEAHSNLDILKKEYRVLAKKYHPDANPEAGRIFLDIQQERAKIMEQFDD